MFYRRVLLDNIEEEKMDVENQYTETDKKMLKCLFEEINKFAGTQIEYLAELDEFSIRGIGNIISQYITKFDSDEIKAILVSAMTNDKIKDCDKIVLNLYLSFKKSEKYISREGETAPAHIYVRYDNAFKHLKPKRLKKELLELACSPRDAFYLPFTIRMLASWKMQEIKEILISYLDGAEISAEMVGLKDETGNYYPSLDYMRRELKFTALDGLKYYPAEDIVAIVKKFTVSKDADISELAQKVLKKIAI